MNLLKILGGVGLVVAGGIVLLLGKSDKKKDDHCCENNQDEEKPQDIRTIVENKYEKFSETDENPYNCKGVLVPEEIMDKKPSRDNRGNDDFEIPVWVRKARIYTDAGSNIGRNLFDLISMGYDYYGQLRQASPRDYNYSRNNNYSRDNYYERKIGQGGQTYTMKEYGQCTLIY
jgi:hypothetical protein